MIAVLIMRTATHNKDCDRGLSPFYEVATFLWDRSPYYEDCDHLFSHFVTPL